MEEVFIIPLRNLFGKFIELHKQGLQIHLFSFSEKESQSQLPRKS